MRAAVALGIGLGALIVGGGIAYAAGAGSGAAPVAATAASYSVSTAIPITPGSSITVPVGSGLAVESTGGTQVTTSNAAVVAPSQPTTTNGFVAIAAGTATLSIPPNSNNPSGAQIQVTVVASTGGAVGSTGGAGSGASIAFSVPSSATLPAGSPQGLVSSGPTSTGWAQSISIVLNTAGIVYQAFYGDVIRISLPAGAHWRASTATMGPSSGIDDFVFTFIEPVTVVLSYTDAHALNQGTTLAFEIGGVFEHATAIATNDYVIFAVAPGDMQATFGDLQSAISLGASNSIESQEANTVQSLAAAVPGGSSAVTVANLLTWFFLSGPWADAWALDPHSVAILPAGTALPSWWPADDTAAATEQHVIARYVGPGLQISASPFPVTAWKRVA